MRSPKWLALAAVVPAVAVAAAGCGSSGSSTGATVSGGAAAARHAAAATVNLRSTGLGRIVVDRNGRTLYLFEADHGGKSACSGACATNWPPLLAKGKPSAGKGVSQAKLATIVRSGGARQVTYAGHPLYRFAGDQAPGDTTGQGLDAFGAEWYVVGAGGQKVEHAQGGATTSSSTAPPQGY